MKTAVPSSAVSSPDSHPGNGSTAPAPLSVGRSTDRLGDSLNWAELSGLWIVLVGIGVVGRLWQPGWNVTPMAAVALAAGAFFPSLAVAASVPLATLAISNLAMPSYGSMAMAVVVYAATAFPVILGWGLRSRKAWTAVAGSALASSLVFFLTTNLAHWWLTTDYPQTPAGLVACFVAALPFYRWMPMGDVAWALAIFGGVSAAVAAARASRADAVA